MFFNYREKKRKQGWPSSKPFPSRLKICSNCFSTIAKDSNHTDVQCKNSKKTKVEKLVNISSPFTLQRVASRDQKASDCPVTPLGGPKKKEEELKKARSNSQTKILLCHIRLATGSQKVIEKSAFMMIQEKNHELYSFFELIKQVYRLKEKATKIIKNMDSKNSMFWSPRIDQ